MGPEDRRQWAQEKREQALDRAQQAGLFGQLTVEDSQINGTFVEADLDEDTGAVENLRLLRNETHTVLDSFAADANATGDANSRGSTVQLAFEDGRLRLEDNPPVECNSAPPSPPTSGSAWPTATT
jgi:hypothetical protein